MRYERPSLKSQYENYIGGAFVPPVDGRYFEDISPVDGTVLCRVPRSNANDVEKALDAAHAAFPAWGNTSATARANMLLKIAQITEDNLELLATVETLDNGKPIRETLNADL
ncbi:MAG: aldehyde dehydrogenase family protein, partial [Bacteroidota bacterium]